MNGPQTEFAEPQPPKPRKPWPLSWVLIAILLYAALQTAYFLFFAK